MQRQRSIDADLALRARRRLQAALGRRPLTPGQARFADDEAQAPAAPEELDLRSASVPVSPRRFDRRHLGVVAVLALVGLAMTAVLVLRARPVTMAAPTSIPTLVASGPSQQVTPVPSSGPSGPSGPSGSPGAGTVAGGGGAALVVHVVGAVREPGVVRLPAGARVADALKAAGGLTGRADPGELNLAQPLGDGQQVVVVTRSAAQREPPEQSEVRQPGASGAAGSGVDGTGDPGAPSGAPVDLNAATEAELDELPGVGPVTAAAILAWRDQHGRFTAVVELQEVDGIGPKTYADLAPLVTV